MPYGENRWLEVAPPGGGTRPVLMKADPQWPETPSGVPGYVLFEADDIEAEYERLSVAGVHVVQPPTQERRRPRWARDRLLRPVLARQPAGGAGANRTLWIT
ncbi:hypothetical protein WBK31_17025 [Nonomuraea sp. N2-4H]|jgi:hypothetical protein|uniref:hypothetical protein n=1 Tax=unclassified Nonomuraea TaxID=2593643 RepID=UPI003247767E